MRIHQEFEFTLLNIVEREFELRNKLDLWFKSTEQLKKTITNIRFRIDRNRDYHLQNIFWNEVVKKGFVEKGQFIIEDTGSYWRFKFSEKFFNVYQNYFEAKYLL
jgi:hypothetical protein